MPGFSAEAAMANIDLDTQTDIDAIRRAIRRSEHAQRARIMLVAAGLATCGIVSVAGTFLAAMF
ncbi:MAG: hypothetical protein ABS75_06025 [Pelagibacterium sp. SCN 63-23]|jgi:hypothetical protein|nr:MAG: hypothetical protein ABS75_06025 [Pelagibacterium sp. SCN 63-23]